MKFLLVVVMATILASLYSCDGKPLQQPMEQVEFNTTKATADVILSNRTSHYVNRTKGGARYDILEPNTTKATADVILPNRTSHYVNRTKGGARYDILESLVSDRDDGWFVIEGDIGVTKEQYAIFMESGWEGLMNSQAWEVGAALWSRDIRYEIDASITDADLIYYIHESIKMIQDTSCLRFYERDPTDAVTPYMKFVDHATGCFVIGLGMPARGAKEIYLNRWCRGAIPAHEILHALGRHHEQSRPDRDAYVDINWGNISEFCFGYWHWYAFHWKASNEMYRGTHDLRDSLIPRLHLLYLCGGGRSLGIRLHKRLSERRGQILTKGLYLINAHANTINFSDPPLEPLKAGKDIQFNMRPLSDTQNIAYDFNSVMHYGSTDFGVNGAITIEPKDDAVTTSRLGQRDGLSFLDVQHLKTRYCNTPLVCGYADYNLEGARICKGAGEVATVRDLQDAGLDNDISSISVDCGLTVTAYEHAIDHLGGGQSYTYYYTWLGLPDNEDVISHFVVSDLQTEVCFYEDPTFSGGSICAGVGGHINSDELNARSLNNKFSSVTVPDGIQVTAYWDNFSGNSKIFVEDSADFGSIDNQISSFIVTSWDTQGCLYQNGDFTGTTVCVGIGEEKELYLGNAPNDNQCSAVKVPVGGMVVAFVGDISTSTMYEYYSTTSLTGSFENDRLSSFRVLDERLCALTTSQYQI